VGSGQTFGFTQQMKYIKKLGLKVQKIIKKNWTGPQRVEFQRVEFTPKQKCY
jgi:hypothetical protein